MRHVLFILLGLPMMRPASAAELANPAAELCVKDGAKIEMETADNGAQRGVCVFPNGTRIGEWAYFRNRNRTTK